MGTQIQVGAKKKDIGAGSQTEFSSVCYAGYFAQYFAQGVVFGIVLSILTSLCKMLPPPHSPSEKEKKIPKEVGLEISLGNWPTFKSVSCPGIRLFWMSFVYSHCF